MQNHIATLKRALQALYDLKPDSDGAGGLRPKAIPLSRAAQPLFNEAYLLCETKARREHGVFAEWLGKGPGRILRLALTFEFMTWSLEPTQAEPEKVSADTMGRAIRYHGLPRGDVPAHHGGDRGGGARGDALSVAKLIIERQWRHFATDDLGREPGFRWCRGEQKGDKERARQRA